MTDHSPHPSHRLAGVTSGSPPGGKVLPSSNRFPLSHNHQQHTKEMHRWGSYHTPRQTSSKSQQTTCQTSDRLAPIKWKSSRQFGAGQDKDIHIESDVDLSLAEKARREWMHLDKELEAGKTQMSLGRHGRPTPPQSPEIDFRKRGGATSMSRNTPGALSPTKKAYVDRWGESPKPTLRKAAIQAPKTWNAGGKKERSHSKEQDHKKFPVISCSPKNHSSPRATQYHIGQVKGSVIDSNDKRWERPGMTDMVPELNQSVSSLAPQLPKRFSSDDSVVSNVAANVVVRGHLVYNIEPSSRSSQVDCFLSGISKPTETSRSWVGRSARDLPLSSNHPPNIPEADGQETDSLDRLMEEKTNPALLEGCGTSSQMLVDDSFRDKETNEKPRTINSFDEEQSEHVIEIQSHQILKDPEVSRTVTNESSKIKNEESDFSQVDTSRVKEMIVDKVPKKKRWSSKNVESFPIWPPVVKVIKFENRNVSGASDGSGFSDELTASEGDFLSSLGDDDLSVEAEMALLLPEQQTTYRIRYDGPTNLANLHEVYALPPVPVHDDRFEPLSSVTDHVPSVPLRTGMRDTVPLAPRRDSSVEDLDDASLGAEHISRRNSRPDVWITPFECDKSRNAVWKVKRVWAVESEDEKEEIHSVPDIDLLSKIKTLVGVPDSPSHSSSPVRGRNKSLEDQMPRRPSRSWHVLSVVEMNGKMNNLGPEKEFADDEFEESLYNMAKEAVDEIELNERALEEAKKRILMLKNSDSTKTPRQAPGRLRRDINRGDIPPISMNLSKSGSDPTDEAATIPTTPQDIPTSNNDPLTPNQEAEGTETSITQLFTPTTKQKSRPPISPSENKGNSPSKSKKKKQQQKSSSKEKSVTLPKVSPKKCSQLRNSEGSLDIPPPAPHLSCPTSTTTIKKSTKKKKKKSKDGEGLGMEEKLTSPSPLPPTRRIYASDMVADNDSDHETSSHNEVEVEIGSPKTPSRMKTSQPSSFLTPNRGKIQAAAMVHDSDSEEEIISETPQKMLMAKPNLDAFKESRTNGSSWWQVEGRKPPGKR